MSKSDSTPHRVTKAPIPMDLCGMAHAATLLGDRWSLLILRAAFYGVTRFDDLRADLGISSATLTTRLADLMEAGLIAAQPYREAKARARKEYRLTPRGRALAPVLLLMMAWADEHLDKQPSPLKIVARDSGAVLRLALVDPDNNIVEWDEAETVIKPVT